MTGFYIVVGGVVLALIIIGIDYWVHALLRGE